MADVAAVSLPRWAAMPLDDNLPGAPELVIEVLSPSNTASEMYEEEAMCLENGCLEFWVADPDKKFVRVSTADSRNVTYRLGDVIKIVCLDSAELPVSGIFASAA